MGFVWDFTPNKYVPEAKGQKRKNDYPVLLLFDFVKQQSKILFLLRVATVYL